jgi:hypothetical protein
MIPDICRLDYVACDKLLARSCSVVSAFVTTVAYEWERAVTKKIDESAALLIRSKIEKLIYEFFYCLDERQYRQLSDMFSTDGVWHRQGKELRGPDAVMDAMKQRPAGFTTRHLITNVIVDIADAEAASARFYMTVFVHEGTEAPKAAVPMAVPMHVSSFEQKFVNRDGQWLINGLNGVATFHR